MIPFAYTFQAESTVQEMTEDLTIAKYPERADSVK